MLESLLVGGLLNASFWGYVGFTLLVTHITIVSVTLFLHRAQAHRSVDFHPAVSHFFRFWLWLTTGQITAQWVAVHRKHHATVETEEDPHSPQIVGILKVLFEGTELYRAAARDPEVVAQYGHGTPDDWVERNLYARHPSMGIVTMLMINIALFGVAGIAIWGIQMMWIPFWAAGVINGLGHYFGYRNYETPDASRNIVPVGLLIGGEEFHNNHHAYSSSARFASKPWEIDIGWWYLRALSALGLARVKKVAPRPVIVPDKEGVDTDTVRAVIINRFHVMAKYGREVVLPVVREELRWADDSWRRLFKRAYRILVREDSQLDEQSRRDLEVVLQSSSPLRTVYQYRLALQELWKRSTASQEYLVEALQEWCRQAEATGIRALQDFARSLRGYSLSPAPAV